MSRRPDEILTLPRFAEVAAYEAEYPRSDHAALWAALGTTGDIVAASRAYWSRRIGDDLANRGTNSTLLFARVFGKVRRSAALRRPPPEKVRPDPQLERLHLVEEPDRVPKPQQPAEQAAAGEADKRPLPSYLVKPEFTLDAGSRASPVTAPASPASAPTYAPTTMLPLAAIATPKANGPEPAVGQETGMLPAPEFLKELIAAADPKAALKKAAAASPQAPPSPARRESVPAHEDTGTAGISMEEVRAAMEAANRAQPGAKADIIDTLSAIAADIRRGVPSASAVASRGMTEQEWRTEQGRVIADPASRRAFDERVEALLRRK